MKTSNTIKDLQLMVEDELLRLANGKAPANTALGICSSIDSTFIEYLDGYALVMELAKGWHAHTGVTGWPVPGGAPPEWDSNTVQGALRLDLCTYLAGKVRACDEPTFVKFLHMERVL